jgi:hypothetical protein
MSILQYARREYQVWSPVCVILLVSLWSVLSRNEIIHVLYAIKSTAMHGRQLLLLQCCAYWQHAMHIQHLGARAACCEMCFFRGLPTRSCLFRQQNKKCGEELTPILLRTVHRVRRNSLFM